MQGYYYKLVSFAFRNGCSFVGAKPLNNVLAGYRGQLVFFFRQKDNSKFYHHLIRTYSAESLTVKNVFYKGKPYTMFVVPVFFRVTRKFLLSFYLFCKKSNHLISIFS